MTETTAHQHGSKWKQLYHRLTAINLFDEDESISLVDQLLSTKFFLSFLAITLSIITVFTAVSIQTQTITIQSPSQAVFEELSLQYPNTLSCPCRTSAIQQKQFLSFHPQYHPICSSQFINQTLISSSLSDINMSEYWPLDYRILVASHFQLLALLCRTVAQTVSDAVEEFVLRHIVTSRATDSKTFKVQTASLFEQLKTTTIANSKYTNDYLWFFIFGNGIYSALRTNYYVKVWPISETTFYTGNYASGNGSCSCRSDSICGHPAGFYNWSGRAEVNGTTVFGQATADSRLLFRVPGMMAGCLPYSSLLQSTLECFFNQSCIDLLQPFINISSSVSPLTSFYFPPNTTVNLLLNELFIETWDEKSNFSGYFYACSPNSCIYSYDRRFNLFYVIVTIISLFGGLKMVLYVSSPWIAKLIRKIQHCKCDRKRNNKVIAINPVETNQRNSKDRLIQLARGIYQKIMQFNLFPTLSNVQDGLYSTRIYIILMSTGVLILVFYASISIQIRNITVYQPTLSEYERLYHQYPSTLVCFCTHLSTPYSSIMNTQPRYHQICSSNLIKNDAWLLYFARTAATFHIFDFRAAGFKIFNSLRILCSMSYETVSNELDVFDEMQFVSARILAKDTFNTQTSVIIQQFQQKTIAAFRTLLELLQTSVQLNQFIVNGLTNTKLKRISWSSDLSYLFTSRNDYDDRCSCGTSISCARRVGFYCRSGPRCFLVENTPNYTISGLTLSCLPIDSFIKSSFECFYNVSCFQMLIQWYSLDLPDFQLDSRVINMTLLDPSIPSRFLPNTTYDQIVSQLFIEDWTNSFNFSSYYHECAPHLCTYTYEERFYIAYIISLVLGIVGGISVALRIVIPFIAQSFRRIYHHCCRSNQEMREEDGIATGFRQKCSMFITHIQHLSQTMNVYQKKQRIENPEELVSADQLLLIQRQKVATRLYMFSFICAIMIVLLFTGLTSQVYSVTISSPTISRYEELLSRHSSTLSCPCSQIAIRYSEFLSVQPVAYHQVCSSNFISFAFINYLWGSEEDLSYLYNADLKVLSTQFRLLASLCTLAKRAVDQQVAIFSSRELITVEILTHDSFQIQINSIIDSFIVQTPVSFRRLHRYIMDMLHANQLHNFFYTNWNVSFLSQMKDNIMSTRSIIYSESNHSCSCATSSTCLRSLLKNYDKTEKLSGIVVGCLPGYGLRLSTLECLYDELCLDKLTGFINSSYTFYPLNVSMCTRFTPTTSIPIGTLIDELFIEMWQKSSNYSSYFSICAPSTCRYTVAERNSPLYMLTTFLGTYGGLTAGLKFVVWYVLLIYWKTRQWCIGRRMRTEPQKRW